MGFYTSISLRLDEREAIAKFMEEHNMKMHEALKFAIRRFFFPEEHSVPLNGREAHLEEVSAQTPNHETEKTIKVEPSEEDEDVFAGLIDKHE
jgi:hypothetical protein